MFEMDGEVPTKISCRPMEKFFNLNENDFTKDIRPENIARVMEKVDGSLISTFTIDMKPHVWMKSKSTVVSDQALLATNKAYAMGADFVGELLKAERDGYTVNLEYTGPGNRIVLPYQEEKLTVLNIRHRDTGAYMPIAQIKSEYKALWNNFVFGVCSDNMSDYQSQVMLNAECIKALEGIEGYIWVMNDGQMVKLKSDWYVCKHKAKDGALNFKYCLEAVLDEKSDDMRAALYDDPIALELLNNVEVVVRNYVSTLVDKVEKFHNENKQLSRKDYAIKGQGELGEAFGLAMLAYQGRELSIRAHVLKQYDMLKFLCMIGEKEGLDE
jgi:T4 RnlA family RNA ligase